MSPVSSSFLTTGETGTEFGGEVQMEAIHQLRAGLAGVDAADLTFEDRLALLELVSRCLDLPAAGGGRKPA